MDLVSLKLIFSALVLFFLLVYWAFNFAIIYHLTRFGIGTQPKKLAAVFFLGAITFFFISVSLLANLEISSLGRQLSKVAGYTFNIINSR